jgi:hypothetical protein
MATNMNTNIPVSVDYTSRDYYALRNDLISRIQTRVPEWQGNDVADFGVAIVEAFSYLGDICNYYIDRVANENFIGTATQRQTVLNIARSYGYTPQGWSAAKTTLGFANTSTTTTYTLPRGTQVATYINLGDTTYKLIFSTITSVVLPPNTTIGSGSVTVEAWNMEDVNPASDYGVKLTTGSDTANQIYTIPADRVIEDSLIVSTYDGSAYTYWYKVQHLGDYGPGDLVYETRIDSNDRVSLFFGDGVSGSIPRKNSSIYVSYSTGGGTRGNIASETIKVDSSAIVYVPGWSSSTLATNNSYLRVTNTQAATGGNDPESTDSIRINAPKALVAFNRAITLKDYQNLAFTIPGIGKARAVATSNSVVSLFVAPYRATGTADLTPGVLSGNVISAELNGLIASVREFVSRRSQIGTTVIVNPPLYSPVTIVATFEPLPGFSVATVQTNLNAALAAKFSYNNMLFNSYYTDSDISAQLFATPGVKSLTITSMYRTASGSGTGALFLDGGDNELFVFNSLVLSAPTEVYLTGLTTYQSADFQGISPAFNPTTYYYSTQFSSSLGGTATATMTFNSGIAVTLNGAAVTSGSPITLPGATAVGTHVYTIVLTSGSATKTYTLTVTSSNIL